MPSESTCLATPHVYTTILNSTTISIAWEAVGGAINYQVEYKLPTAITWTQLPVQTTTTAIINTLTSETTYMIRVVTICSESLSCTSVTITNSTM